MDSKDSVKVEMDFNSRSRIIKLIKTYTCNWGQKVYPKNFEGQLFGATSPLWLNENTFFFGCFSALFGIISVLFIGFYVFLRYYNNNNILSGLLVRNYTMLDAGASYAEFISNSTIPTNSTEMEPSDVYCLYIAYNKINSIFIIVGGVIFFANFIHMMYLGCFVEYQNDEEWSRNLSISSFIWILMVGFIIGDIIYSVSLIIFYNDHANFTNVPTAVSNTIDNVVDAISNTTTNTNATGSNPVRNLIMRSKFRYLQDNTTLNTTNTTALNNIVTTDMNINLVSGINNKTGFSNSLFNNNTPNCKELFQINMFGYLIVGAIAAILAVFQIMKIISISKKYFFSNAVPHTARCEDDNIIVIQ